jgi:hypothetical protein
MRSRHALIRTFLFVFLLACLLTGLAGVVRVPVNAAPKQANALDVVINEIAWGGTAASSADEWIELYNTTATDIDLTNWTIVTLDLNPATITIPSGIIPANGYFLLERSETAVSNITADYVYGGSNFANSGETLTLYDELNVIIDTVNNNGGGWPAGSGAPNYASMERINNLIADSDANWVSNDGITINGLDANNTPIRGTPKQVNSATLSLTPTATPLVTDTSTPSPTAVSHLALVINEVAWAGTDASTSDEWIELYNPGGGSVKRAGWV